MKQKNILSPASKMTVFFLIVATVGVIIQIVSGVDYPTIPPVFFILLIPAALLSFSTWRWAPVSAVIATVFLTAALFLSGAAYRLIYFKNTGGSIGLWIQALGVLVALIGSVVATCQNYYRSPSKPPALHQQQPCTCF